MRAPGDAVARLGGDEFAILLERVIDAPTRPAMADRVRGTSIARSRTAARGKAVGERGHRDERRDGDRPAGSAPSPPTPRCIVRRPRVPAAAEALRSIRREPSPKEICRLFLCRRTSARDAIASAAHRSRAFTVEVLT